MDFLSPKNSSAWQMKARKFAEEEIRPITLERDASLDPAKTFTWDIIKKGSKLGFRTCCRREEARRSRHRLRHPGAGHGRTRPRRQRHIQDVQPMLEVESCHPGLCTGSRKRFLPAFIADDTFVMGSGSTEPSAGSDNRLPPDDPRSGVKLRAERKATIGY